MSWIRRTLAVVRTRPLLASVVITMLPLTAVFSSGLGCVASRLEGVAGDPGYCSSAEESTITSAAAVLVAALVVQLIAAVVLQRRRRYLAESIPRLAPESDPSRPARSRE